MWGESVGGCEFQIGLYMYLMWVLLFNEVPRIDIRKIPEKNTRKIPEKQETNTRH